MVDNIDYDIIVSGELFSINPKKNNLKKKMIKYIIQEYIGEKENPPTTLELNLPYYLTKSKLQASNRALATETKGKVKWEQLVAIFKENIHSISNMTLSEINKLIRIKQKVSLEKVTHPIKDFTETNIINLLGRGEQTPEGEKWIGGNLSEDETKVYLDEVWEKISTGNTRNFSFNDEKIKVNKLKELNVSNINRRTPFINTEKGEGKTHKASLPKDSIISLNYWKKSSPKTTPFNIIHGSTDKENIGMIIYTIKENIIKMLDLWKVDLDLDSNSGYPILISAQDGEGLSPNTQVTIADNLVTITEIEEVKNGNFIAWFNEQPYDSTRWKAGSKTDDERRNIYRESDLQESTKEEIIKAAILMIMRPLLTNMKTSYRYEIKINSHKHKDAITITTTSINDITTTEQSPRATGQHSNQDYGTPLKDYKPKTILRAGAKHGEVFKAQMFLRKINYAYNTLNRTIDNLGE